MTKGQYPWPYPKPITNAGESIRTCMTSDPRDWSTYKRDAWLWGIVMGWDDALDDVAEQHGWTEETKRRIKMLHEHFDARFPQWWK